MIKFIDKIMPYILFIVCGLFLFFILTRSKSSKGSALGSFLLGGLDGNNFQDYYDEKKNNSRDRIEANNDALKQVGGQSLIGLDYEKAIKNTDSSKFTVRR